jgi:hypothetical protein
LSTGTILHLFILDGTQYGRRLLGKPKEYEEIARI